MGNIDSAVKFYDVASREFIQTKQVAVLSLHIESIEDQVIFTKSLVKFSLNEVRLLLMMTSISIGPWQDI